VKKAVEHHPLPPHPVQPIVEDGQGVQRFRANAIVRCLLERDGGDLASLAKLATGDELAHFAQLLGLPISDPRFAELRGSLATSVAVCSQLPYGPHPMQPVHLDEHGVIRFRKNVIVDVLVDRDSERGRVYPDFPARTNGGLNWISMQDFSQEDQEQLAQLIGYSVSGYHELDYVSDESAAQASKLAREILPKAGGCRDDGCPCHGGPL